MSVYLLGTPRVQKWYNRNIFPLVPLFEYRKTDKHNTCRFNMRWLFFTIWTLDTLCFEISIVADTHWGIGIIGIFPYIRWRATIPCPLKIGMWIDTHLSRAKYIYNNSAEESIGDNNE